MKHSVARRLVVIFAATVYEQIALGLSILTPPLNALETTKHEEDECEVFLCDAWKQRDERPNVGGGSTRNV